MAWPDYMSPNGPAPARVLLEDIVLTCDQRLMASQLPSSLRSYYQLIRSHATLCVSNVAHGKHADLIAPDGSPVKDIASFDKAYRHVLNCFNFLMLPPTFTNLQMALNEIDHSAGGTATARP